MQNGSTNDDGPSKRGGNSGTDASLTLALPTPSSFPVFPYTTPYPIQLELMRHLYDAIESRRVAVVESPTGTGKTLSLLCATLTWLEEDRRRMQKGKIRALEGDLDDGEPEWVRVQTVKRLKDQLFQAELEMNERLREAKDRESERKKGQIELRNGDSRATKRRKILEDDEDEDEEDREFLPRDVDGDSCDFVSATLRKVLKATRIPEQKDSSNPGGDGGTKIYFASRTHSQLAQVLSELARINMQILSLHDAEPSITPDTHGITSNSHPRTVSLASRRHLCINEDLRTKMVKRGREGDLDDACRDIRNEKGCPYLPPPGTDSRMDDARDAILATPKDIEDLVSTGNAFRACPYYAARSAVPLAQIVALPYNLLLNANSRDALDIKLKDQIVVIDEAHNLPETLLGLHTVELTSVAIKASARAAEGYLTRFKTRLGAIHALHLKRFVRFLKEVESFLGARESGHGGSPADMNATDKHTVKIKAEPETDVMKAPAFLEEVGRAIDGINFLELKSYLQNSKAAQKISAYARRCASKEEVATRRKAPVAIQGKAKDTETTGEIQASALYAVESFLCALMNDKEDGRVILSWEIQGNSRRVRSIKYQHLNPATYFADVVTEARCVVLAGGTMSPIPDMAAQLFPSIVDERLSTFSCGHIIPPANLKCIVVGKGPKGRELVLKYGQRDREDMLDEVGQLLANLVTLVPKGLVVFFPSYSFLENAKSSWTRSGLLERLAKKKTLFYEPQSTSDVESVLHAYSLAVHENSQGTGALLMAVVGAKLSEGLNFVDDLARAVVVVGLPYPNLASAELKERMKYVSSFQKKASEKGGARDPGAELYENLCMRAVNQSIGRAIRHREDWASLILVDARYASQRVRNKLPRWIDASTVVTETFGQVVKELSGFYRSKRN